MSRGRNLVGTYRRQGTFRAQHAEKTGRAAQNTPLPPRCRDCRLPGTIGVMIGNVKEFFCTKHVPIRDDDEVCGESFDHDWQPGDPECRRCYADLSEVE